MYHEYFGLSEPAFSIAVNPRYLYMSDQHKEALAHLLYGVQSGGFVLLTGEVGTGKTTIIRSLLEQIPDNTDMAMVLNPMASVNEMIAGICDELGASYSKNANNDAQHSSLKELIDSLYKYLLENHRRGRNTVLLIDEAQLLTPEALEQIRLLTNLETNTQKLLQIVLVGQPELNALLSQPRLRQLAQRITARFHLSPLTLNETEAYISHRLHVAGLTQERNPFSGAYIKKIHRLTGGIPRRINILCERIMIGLYGHNQHRVDSRIFQAAAKEVVGGIQDESSAFGFTHNWLKHSIFILVILLSLSFLYIAYQRIQVAAPLQNTVIQTPASTVESVKAKTLSEKSQYEIRRLTNAQSEFFRYVGVAETQGSHPCWSTTTLLQCKTLKLNTWASLQEINRPVVLTLTTQDKFTAYAVLVGLSKTSAVVLGANGETLSIALNELGEKWTGQVFYIWHRPPEFSSALSVGDTGASVTWLAEQFALMDHQDNPLATFQYTIALRERVKIFQRQVGLQADGILGEQTILKLNAIMGIDKTLLENEEN